MPAVIIRREQKTQTHRKTVWLQTQRSEWWVYMSRDVSESPKATRGKEGFSRRAFRENVVLLMPDFGLLACRTVTDISVVLSHAVCGTLAQQHQETNTLLLTEFLGGWPSVPVFSEHRPFSVKPGKSKANQDEFCHSTFWPTFFLNSASLNNLMATFLLKSPSFLVLMMPCSQLDNSIWWQVKTQLSPSKIATSLESASPSFSHME